MKLLSLLQKSNYFKLFLYTFKINTSGSSDTLVFIYYNYNCYIPKQSQFINHTIISYCQLLKFNRVTIRFIIIIAS